MTSIPDTATLGWKSGRAICHGCRAICEMGVAQAIHCARCGAAVHFRVPRSLQKTSAYLVAAALLYLPANMLPIMHTSSVLGERDDTILSGVVLLMHSGSWPLALLVLFASVVVPLMKILSLALLMWMSARGARSHLLARARLYRVVAVVGRWSMLDIYVVTLLVALVHMGAVASVEARPGAVAFAAVVVLTMKAADSFDPRLIWDYRDSHDRIP